MATTYRKLSFLKTQKDGFLLLQSGGKVVLESVDNTKTGVNRTLARQRAFELPKVI